MACKKGAQGAKVFRNAQVISKHIKNQKMIMQYLNTFSTPNLHFAKKNKQ